MTAVNIRRASRLALLLLGIAGSAASVATEIRSATPVTINDQTLAILQDAMAGTPHDFYGGLPGASDSRPCRGCHVVERVSDGRLVTLRDCPPIAATPVRRSARPDAPSDRVSRYCLSCHDGTVSPEVAGVRMGMNRLLGPLTAATSNDHQLSIEYGSSARLTRETTAPVAYGDGSTGTIDDLLVEGTVQCTACHDVHNVRTVTDSKLLRFEPTLTGVCTTCHPR